MKLNVINRSTNPLPKNQTVWAAGYDVCSNEQLTIFPGKAETVGTGLYVEVPNGCELQVRSRSGLAANHRLFVLNSPGCIDPDYRGEVKVILFNAGDEAYLISKGDRIAQFILTPVFSLQWQEVTQLTTTDRERGGFGSTG